MDGDRLATSGESAYHCCPDAVVPHAPPAQVTQHGACLGLGLAALGSEDEEVFEEVKNVLYTSALS